MPKAVLGGRAGPRPATDGWALLAQQRRSTAFKLFKREWFFKDGVLKPLGHPSAPYPLANANGMPVPFSNSGIGSELSVSSSISRMAASMPDADVKKSPLCNL
jgi:hypothetical protein